MREACDAEDNGEQNRDRQGQWCNANISRHIFLIHGRRRTRSPISIYFCAQGSFNDVIPGRCWGWSRAAEGDDSAGKRKREGGWANRKQGGARGRLRWDRFNICEARMKYWRGNNGRRERSLNRSKPRDAFYFRCLPILIASRDGNF